MFLKFPLFCEEFWKVQQQQEYLCGSYFSYTRHDVINESWTMTISSRIGKMIGPKKWRPTQITMVTRNITEQPGKAEEDVYIW